MWVFFDDVELMMFKNKNFFDLVKHRVVCNFGILGNR